MEDSILIKKNGISLRCTKKAYRMKFEKSGYKIVDEKKLIEEAKKKKASK